MKPTDLFFMQRGKENKTKLVKASEMIPNDEVAITALVTGITQVSPILCFLSTNNRDKYINIM